MPPTPKLHAAPFSRTLHAFGDKIDFHFIGDDTGNQLTQGIITVQPGGGTPLHYHAAEDEFFVVLNGQASFYAGSAWHPVGIGARVACPRGSVHAYKNTGDTPLELLLTVTPSGFENFFARCAAEFAKPSGPDHSALLAIAADSGIHFVET